MRKVSLVNYTFDLITDFVSEISNNRFVVHIENFFNPDMSSIQVNTEENMLNYKLTLLSKSLKNYFKKILEDTNDILVNSSLQSGLKGNLNVSNNELKKVFKKYMSSNLNIVEISFFDKKGRRVIGVKYNNVKNYSLSNNLLKLMNYKKNILIKGSSKDEIVLVSALRGKNNDLVGFLSQTLSSSFFTRILDFLNIGHDNLFYLRTANNEIIVDNFKAYSYLDQKKSKNYLDKVYSGFKSSQEEMIKIKADDIEYSVGIIIDKNNTLGNVVSFVILILLLYLNLLIISYVFNHLSVIFRRRKEENIKMIKLDKISSDSK